jgi:hypothetical protein
VIQQMVMSSAREVALFAAITLNGDYAFTPTAFRRRLAGMLPPGQAVEWGDSSQTSGVHPTKFVTFALPEKRLRCVGMERSFKDHPETSGAYSQGMAIGYYCRPGEPFSIEQAESVVAALHTAG